MFSSEKLSFPLLNLVRLPDITIDNKTKKKFGVDLSVNNAEFLRQISQSALNKLTKDFSPDKQKIYQDRLNFELALVEELSFTDYFLLVWKVINKMIDMQAFRDMGRGSCAGSLVFYVLGVTGVDPIRYNLLFARFISKVRAKKQVIDGITYLQGDLAPDVDLNLGGARDEIISWLNKEYEGRVCPISTFGTLTGKVLIKEVYKTLEDVQESEANRVSNLVDKHFGIVEDIEKMPEKNKEFKEWSEQHARTYAVALQLRDLIKNKGSHASGYFIAYDLLAEHYPLDLNKEKEPILTFEMKVAAKLGIKLDCLGLTTNQIIQEVLDGTPETIEDLMPKLHADPLIYDQYQHGTLLPYGLYQISADCAYKALLAIKPKDLNELSDLNALARPGALAYLDGYVKGDNPCPHPAFSSILGPTRNYCLYQEQMIQMAVALGFTPEEGELIRRVVGKKMVDEVKLWKDRIYEKCKQNNFSHEIGDLFWKILDDSSKYSFNLSHAAATASLSALTTYLKYKYPIQFYTACLNNIHNFPNPMEHLSEIFREVEFFGIRIVPPSISNPETKFTYNSKNEILMPISSIKGISKKAIDKLRRFKVTDANKIEIFKAAEDAEIPRNIFSSIVLAGSMDKFLNGGSRSKLLLEFVLYKKLTDKEKNFAAGIFTQCNNSIFDCVKYMNETAKDEKGKPVMKDSRRETLKAYITPHWQMFKQNEKHVDLAYYFFEKELLGFAYTKTLMDIYGPNVPDLTDIRAAKNSEDKEYCRIIGNVIETKRATSKKGTDYLKVVIGDEKESITCMMFNTAKNRSIDNCQETNGRLPEEKDIVICSGQKNGDAVFLDTCGIQDVSVWLKVSQIKES